MFNKMKERLDDEEFQVSDNENLADMLDEQDDILTSKVSRLEVMREEENERQKLDNTLDDLI